MKASEGKIGRVFVVRLETGDEVPACIETFAAEKDIAVAGVTFLGSVGRGRVVVGSSGSDRTPSDPLVLPFEGAHEVAALGVIAPGNDGKPQLHMHGALGRESATKTGCLRKGVEVRLLGEVIVQEILGTGAARVWDEKTRHELLEPEGGRARSRRR